MHIHVFEFTIKVTIDLKSTTLLTCELYKVTVLSFLDVCQVMVLSKHWIRVDGGFSQVLSQNNIVLNTHNNIIAN